MRRFFADQPITDSHIYLSQPESHHIRNVLRMRCGEEIIVCDHVGAEYKGVLEGLDDKCCVRIISLLNNVAEPDLKLTLCQCMPKGDKMEWIIQKCTELGVSRVIPVLSARCVSRPEGRDAVKKRERWQKIAEQASKQCGRSVVPALENITPLRALPHSGRRFLAYELENSVSLANIDLSNERELFLLIGPEGGFEEQEIGQARNAGAVPVTLGRRILRTETAGITTLSILMYHLECAEVQ